MASFATKTSYPAADATCGGGRVRQVLPAYSATVTSSAHGSLHAGTAEILANEEPFAQVPEIDAELAS
jgi:hypothetical protein